MRFAAAFVMIGLLGAGAALSRQGGETPAATGSPVASCANCHAGEVSTWSAGDPHAKAYGVLFNETSSRIMANLGKGDASQDATCLACHGPNQNAVHDGESLNAASDGVGCDSCHGPSARWLDKHYEPSWKSLDLKSKANLGFLDTKNLSTRITTCTSCHVGDAVRQVNHDLIAAGHPRLAFEYTRFHYQPGYQKHWKEKLPERDFEIRAWLVGQAAALRAVHAQAKQSPRADLSELSCFACHHDLSVPAKPSAGQPAWQPWYTALATVLQKQVPASFPSRVTERTGASVDAWLGAIERSEARLSNEQLLSLARDLALSGSQAREWDSLAQHYLALAALYHADWSTLAAIREPLEKLKVQIKYPTGFNSPSKADLAMLRPEFEAMAKILTQRAAP